MALIQLVLIFGILGSLAFYLKYLRTQVADRLIVLVLFCIASATIIFPSVTVRVAHLVGVGRGTDLVFYLFILAAIFVGIMLYSKIAKLQEVQTELIRYLALREGREPGVKD